MFRQHIVVLLRFVPVFVGAYVIGRMLGKLYLRSVVPFIPEFFSGLVFNWLFIGLVVALVLLPLENRYVWSKFYKTRKEAPGVYEIAPASLGVAAGMILCWVY